MNHLRFLHYVDEVARVGSIRQAATRLHVAPSAVMRRVQDLESELGTAIFERLPRGMRLTAAGELFVRYIRLRSADLERVRSEIEELRGLRRGSLLLIASQALATSFLPGVIAAFHKSHALVEFRIRIGNQTTWRSSSTFLTSQISNESARLLRSCA
jgi:DNA-binding transcriptional LysR family regulator